jgi:hypothetical protein
LWHHPDKGRPTVSHATDLVDHLYISSYAHEHLKLASDRMKTRYDSLANYAGYFFYFYFFLLLVGWDEVH